MGDDLFGLVIDSSSAVAPFEQLRTRIAGLAFTGELAPGAKLPTVRRLASELGLAANTVARAYRELEADGVIVTQGRRGTFVHSMLLEKPPSAELAELADGFVTAARRSGLSLPESVRLVEQAWRT
jgi:DNA-binding transcriptional regulator YhcF (GntR family)